MTASRRRTLRAVPVALTAFALAACSQPQPEPQPVEVDGPPPVVVPDQLDRIVEQVSAAVAAGDEAGSAEALAPRVDGAALQLRTAAYTVRAADADLATPEPVLGERLVDVVPEGEDWPRFVLTVTEPTPDAVPRLNVLTQPDARSPYRLSAAATLLPGVTLPRTPAEGTETVPVAEADGLTMSPADALNRYAAVLTNGAADENAAAFTEDAFRTAVLGEQEAERVAATETCEGCFAYAVSHVPRQDASWAVRTEDGGALVVGVLDGSRSFAVAAEGAKLPIPGDLAVLSGDTEATSGVRITAAEVVALYIPPEGSDDLVTVVAADRGTVAVSAV